MVPILVESGLTPALTWWLAHAAVLPMDRRKGQETENQGVETESESLETLTNLLCSSFDAPGNGGCECGNAG